MPYAFNCYIRSSRPEVFCKSDVLKNFVKSQENTCVGVSFFNKVVDLRPATLLKKRLQHRCFPLDFTKFLRTFFFTEHLRATPSVLFFSLFKILKTTIASFHKLYIFLYLEKTKQTVKHDFHINGSL